MVEPARDWRLEHPTELWLVFAYKHRQNTIKILLSSL